MTHRAHAVLALLLASAPITAHAQVGSRDRVPVQLPERPFLLVDAPRRFLPRENAQVRVQLSGGGDAHISVFRVRDPSVLLGQAGRRQGVSVARTSVGADAEALVARTDALPRRGQVLSLVRHRRLAMPRPEGARAVWNETTVYDSNEDVEDGVATYWVRAGAWSVRRVSVGRLPAGLYLVQVRAAAWVSSALISVGDIVLVARRGDRQDIVRVTNAEGAPRPGVRVIARRGADDQASARTGADGIARFAASDAEVLRFVASRGNDLAWADVAHVRLRPCDPRVYVATGRPVYRTGERQHVRGHVRGCIDDRYAPLANRTVTLRSGDQETEATTDADGNFVAQLTATDEIVATLDGREHRRPVRIDHRRLPRRNLIVRLDRPWAAAGELVQVHVSDEGGGWPHDASVVLDTPSGRLVGRVGPHRPAIFAVRVPDVGSTAERLTLNASLTVPGRVTMASAELFVGRSAIQLELRAEEERGRSGETFAVEARASDLGGQAVDGPVRFEIYGSDGNERRGRARARHEARLAAGRVAVRLPLTGPGPWMIRATHAEAETQLVVWARRRPPSLARRGDLAVLPLSTHVRPDERLGVDVRLPRGGSAWLTLEQGGVLVSRHVRAAGRVSHVELPIPPTARGLASLVLTHVRRGRARTATATVEVETARPVTLDVTTDHTVYGGGATAHVNIEAKTDGGAPRDGVVSLWLADAGYWGLGEEDYPLPGDYLRLPGRPASGGDSQTPIAYGAEEGRRLESELVFDGQRLSGATHRHGWRFGGEVIAVRADGSLQDLAGAIARAARLRGARVTCPEDTEAHSLRARGLPWDLIAMRLAELLEAEVGIDDRRLIVDCTSATGFGMGSLGTGGGGGTGHGYGQGSTVSREERLEGTLHFVGLSRLGPDGRLELDVPLPDHPGRWRVEVLTIADDGGGARGHQVVHTRSALEAWVDVPGTLRPGDRVGGVLRVLSGGGEGSARVRLTLTPQVRLVGTAPMEIALGPDGRGEAPIVLEGVESGNASITLEVATSRGSRAHRDRVRTNLAVLPPSNRRELYSAAVVGPRATQVEIPLPALARPATLTIDLHANLQREVAALLRELREPRWDLGVMRADRLASLTALRRALGAQPASASTGLLLADLNGAIDSELHALATMRTSTGEIGWGDHADPLLTLEVLEHVPNSIAAEWSAARAHLRERLERGELHGEAAARAAHFVLPVASDAVLDRALQESGDDPRALSQVLLAADHHSRHRVARRAADRLVAAIRTRLASPTGPTRCQGWAWYLCFNRRGERGTLAQAALALAHAEDRRAARVGAEVGEWLSRQPIRPTRFAWGTDEADVLELLANRSRGVDRVLVFIDGRRVGAGPRVRIPAGAHRLELRFAERPARLRRIVVRGDVDAEDPSSPQGNVRLTRTFDQREGRWQGRVSFTLPRRARSVTLEIPLPSGLTVDQRQLVERHASIVDGAIRFRWDELPRGPHELTLPLIATASGSFAAGPAALSANEGELYGLTIAQRVDLAP